MNPQRFLCSQLVSLTHRCDDAPGDSVVNLEEIWTNGAIVEAEMPVKKGVEVELRCGPAFFAGRIVEVESHDFGWRLEVEFSPRTLWNPDEFRPEHMLDPSSLVRPNRPEN